jgi:formylglycine-generating enzyme required for sulfatase activity
MSQSVRRPVSQVEDFKARFGVVQGQRGDQRLSDFAGNSSQGSGFSSRQMVAAIALAMLAGMSGAGVFWFAQDFGAQKKTASETAASSQPTASGTEAATASAVVVKPAAPQVSTLPKTDDADSPVLTDSEYGTGEASPDPVVASKPIQEPLAQAAPQQAQETTPAVAEPPPVAAQQPAVPESTAPLATAPETAAEAPAAPAPAQEAAAVEPQPEATVESQAAQQAAPEAADPTSAVPETPPAAPEEQDVALATPPAPETALEPAPEAAPQPVPDSSSAQQAETPAIAPGQVWRDCDVCPDLVAIIAPKPTAANGVDLKFTAGDAPNLAPFAIGRFEVTFDDWSLCVAAGACTEVPDAGWGGGSRPVINVSHQMIAEQYLPWLSNISGKTYRLPTSYEWDVAEAGGEAAANRSVPSLTAQSLCRSSNYAAAAGGAACNDPFAQTSPAGSYESNAIGLYDMRGNVWEWVSDCWTPGFNYKTKPSERDCRKRVVRGGSWSSQPALSALAPKGFEDQTRASRTIGFRISRSLP